MINMVKLPTNKSSLFLRVAKGHFATSHSHINYYIDVTTQKARLSEAKAVAKELVAAYQHVKSLIGAKSPTASPHLVSQDSNVSERLHVLATRPFTVCDTA